MYKNLHIPLLMLAAAAMIIARLYVTAAGDGSFSPASEDQTICFPLDENDKVDFIAYCPQAALTGNTYAVDVTDQSYPAAIDLLWSNNATALDKTVQTVDLKFYHRLSRIYKS